MITLIVLIGSIIALPVFAGLIFMFRAKIKGKADMEDLFNWRLLVNAAVGTLILFSPVMIYGGDSEILYMILIALLGIILILVALVLALFKNWAAIVTIFSMLLANWVLSWCLLKNFDELHGITKWNLHSKKFRTQLITQSNPVSGEFKHIEWDVSGFAGLETVVYLVFDPTDSLAAAAKSHLSGKFSGIPCEVYRVRRMESHYYTVVFYTNTGWDSCDY